MTAPLRIGVVGLGASGVVTTIALVRELVARHASPGFEVTVYERSGPGPAGVAYGTKHAAHVLNMRASTMSIDPDRPNEFVDWLRPRRGAAPAPTGEDYVARSWYREYLDDRLADAGALARAHGGTVRVRPEEVTAVAPDVDRVRVAGPSGVSRFDHVVLCPGETHGPPHPGLTDHPGYVASAWDYDRISAIPPHAAVGIVGTSLSAIDVVLLLHANGHRGPVHAVSRTRPLPKVQGPRHPHELRHLTLRNLRLLTAGFTRSISLSDAAVLFRLELQDALGDAIDWAGVVRTELGHQDHARQLAADIRAAEQDATRWYSVLDATGEVVLDYWRHLDRESRRAFAAWRPHWATYRHCMPLPTARTLHALLEEGRFRVTTGLRGLDRVADDGFLLRMTDEDIRVDHLVNARGVSGESAASGPPIVRTLLRDAVAAPHPDGGLDVEFDTGRLIGPDGQTRPRLSLVGPQTCGVHFYTNSMETLVRTANQAARSAVPDLLRSYAAAG